MYGENSDLENGREVPFCLIRDQPVDITRWFSKKGSFGLAYFEFPSAKRGGGEKRYFPSSDEIKKK